MIIIDEVDEGRVIILELLELLKKNKLGENEKQKIYDIVQSLEKRTENQKKKFVLLYGLEKGQKERYRMCDLVIMYDCAPSTIRNAAMRVEHTLMHLKDERMSTIKSILEEYKNKQ